jgi:hypothetical protein
MNRQIKGGKVHKYNSDSSNDISRCALYMCGVPADFVLDKKTSEAVTCRNCLKVMGREVK